MRVILGFFAIISGFLSAFFLLWFYEDYWRHRDCFTSEGKCWDYASQHVYDADSFIIILPAIFFFFIMIVLFYFSCRKIDDSSSCPPTKADA